MTDKPSSGLHSGILWFHVKVKEEPLLLLSILFTLLAFSMLSDIAVLTLPSTACKKPGEVKRWHKLSA